MTSQTLLTGWWGFVSFACNWVVIVVNAVALFKLGRMAPPIGGDPSLRLTPGKTIWTTPGFAVLLALVLAVIGIVGFNISHDQRVGECLRANSSSARSISCSSPHDGKVVAVVTNRKECPAEADILLRGIDDKILCVDSSQ